MAAKHEVIYGGMGSGKSSYAFSIINPLETFKLGNGNLFQEIFLLKLGSIKRHEDETGRKNIEFKNTTLDSVIEDISQIKYPTLLLDEWTTFFLYSFWWPKEEIANRANEILNSVENNPNIGRGIYITSDYMPYLPFNLYKKRALWNKVLFKRADKITKINYGLPIFQKE